MKKYYEIFLANLKNSYETVSFQFFLKLLKGRMSSINLADRKKWHRNTQLKFRNRIVSYFTTCHVTKSNHSLNFQKCYINEFCSVEPEWYPTGHKPYRLKQCRPKIFVGLNFYYLWKFSSLRADESFETFSEFSSRSVIRDVKSSWDTSSLPLNLEPPEADLGLLQHPRWSSFW